MTKAFITGITGMVGSHLADFLLQNTDWEVHGLVRWRSDLANIRHLSQRINRQDRVFLHYGDLNDYGSLLASLEEVVPEFVFHLAAHSYPKTSFLSPIECLETNVLGTTRLLEAIKRLGISAWVHVCSSSEVFGRVDVEQLPIDENCSFHPASPYAISKMGTDAIGRFYAEAYGMKVVTTRMFTHTGPRRGDVFAESSFAKQIALAEAGLSEPVIRVGNLESLRTYADVRDAVRAYYMLLTHNPLAGEVYNIGGTTVKTVGQMLSHLIETSSIPNLTVRADQERFRPIDADLQVPDTSKFQRHTGWKSEISFEQTMSDLLDYWRDEISRSGASVIR